MFNPIHVFVFALAHLVFTQSLFVIFSGAYRFRLADISWFVISLAVPGILMLVSYIMPKWGYPVDIYMLGFILLLYPVTGVGLIKGFIKWFRAPSIDNTGQRSGTMAFLTYVFVSIVVFWALYHILPEYGIQSTDSP